VNGGMCLASSKGKGAVSSVGCTCVCVDDRHLLGRIVQ
jgi:hypothetical protein